MTNDSKLGLNSLLDSRKKKLTFIHKLISLERGISFDILVKTSEKKGIQAVQEVINGKKR